MDGHGENLLNPYARESRFTYLHNLRVRVSIKLETELADVVDLNARFIHAARPNEASIGRHFDARAGRLEVKVLDDLNAPAVI